MKAEMRRFLSLLASALLAAGASVARADVGEPMGAGPGNTFGIKITHGGTVLVDNPLVPFPADLKPIFVDGTSETSTTIGSLGLGSPVILKIVSDGGAVEPYRVLHFYVDVPDAGNPDIAGPLSLFDPSDSGRISVQVSNIKFAGTIDATPRVEDNNSFFTSFMRDGAGGFFYELPGANAYNSYGHTFLDIQVPGELYLDGNATDYNFSATGGAVTSWDWSGIINPGPVGSLVNDGFGNSIGSGTPAGFVYELGLGVAFTGIVPEPATLTLLAAGAASLLRRKRRGR